MEIEGRLYRRVSPAERKTAQYVEEQNLHIHLAAEIQEKKFWRFIALLLVVLFFAAGVFGVERLLQ